MYLPGEEFEYEIDGVIEDFTCIKTIVINDKEYLIAENEYELKKVFIYDIIEEEIELVDEEEEEMVLESYENDSYMDTNDNYYNEWENDYDDDYEYDDSEDDMENSFIIDEEGMDDSYDNEDDDDSQGIDEEFLLSLFDEDEE